MATSILIARLIGPVLVVAAVSMLTDPKGLREMARGFLKDRALIFLSGVLAMVGGLAVVNAHNVWVLDWPVIITVIGWAAAIGGAIRMAAPPLVKVIGEAMLGQPVFIRVAGVVWLLLGAFLSYVGYV